MDDFEHLEHVQDGQSSHLEARTEKAQQSPAQSVDMEKDMINFSFNQTSNEPEDPSEATLLLLESEKSNFEVRLQEPEPDLLMTGDQLEVLSAEPVRKEEEKPETKKVAEKEEEVKEAKVPVLEPETVPAADKKADSWNVVERDQPVEEISKEEKKDDSASEYVLADEEKKGRVSAPETGESEFESEVEASPAKCFKPVKQETRRDRVEEVEIAPKEIFSSMGIGEYSYSVV